MMLENQVALVTGGARGIGKAISEALATAGARVIVSDIDLAAAQATAAELSQKGPGAVAVAADVSNSASVEAIDRKSVV